MGVPRADPLPDAPVPAGSKRSGWRRVQNRGSVLAGQLLCRRRHPRRFGVPCPASAAVATQNVRPYPRPGRGPGPRQIGTYRAGCRTRPPAGPVAGSALSLRAPASSFGALGWQRWHRCPGRRSPSWPGVRSALLIPSRGRPQSGWLRSSRPRRRGCRRVGSGPRFRADWPDRPGWIAGRRGGTGTRSRCRYRVGPVGG